MNEPHTGEPAQAHRLLRVALCAAIAVIVALAIVVVLQYRTLEAQQLLGSHGSFLSSLKTRNAVTPEDGAFVEAWMTFDYVNHVFSLPPQYLEQTLGISDPRYPRVAIEEYAEDAHLDEAATLEKVRSAVETYSQSQ